MQLSLAFLFGQHLRLSSSASFASSELGTGPATRVRLWACEAENAPPPSKENLCMKGDHTIGSDLRVKSSTVVEKGASQLE